MAKFSNPLGGEFYVDNRLSVNLLKQRRAVLEKDKDRFFAVDGAEGSGKSVFAQQIATALDPSFTIGRMCFSPAEFKRAVLSASKGQAVVFDEAFTGLSSRASLSKINNLLVSLMMEMRQKNLFVIIVLPTFFLLDKYVALWRTSGLFHIFTKAGKRGYWVYFNKSKKKLLYLYGKKDYTYRNANIPKTGFKGVFFDKYTVDEKLYRARKKIALEDKEFGDDDEQKYYFQRNVLLKVLKDELHLSYDKISVLLAEYDLKLDKSSIFRAVKNNTKLKRGEDN